MAADNEFSFKEGTNVFTPKDLVELGRPGAALANFAGDLALVPFSEYSFETSKNNKSVYIVSLDKAGAAVQIPLEKGGETFWIADRTFAHVVQSDDKSEVYAYELNFDAILSSGSSESESSESESESTADRSVHPPPKLIGTIPSATAANFKFNPKTNTLVFSAYVYPDGNLDVKEKDRQWEERGTTALVFDATYVRHWDVWQGKKGPQLFAVQISAGKDGLWTMSGHFKSPLKGTKHYSPVEPFGGTDDFDVSDNHIAYTTKDPVLPEAWHTKQNVYIVPLDGERKPIELTSGKQGATHSVVFSTDGSKVAWLELDEDGYEADRFKIVIFDLAKLVRFTVTQAWDRSPSELAFSKDDRFIYLTAGDEAKVKVFVLPVPPTPEQSTTDPKLKKKYSIPVALTEHKAASALQTLPGGKIVFSRSSFTSPNDVFVIRDTKKIEEAILADSANDDEVVSKEVVNKHVKIEQLTTFAKKKLEGKDLSEGEEFWFEGAHHVKVQGWALKPKGWKHGQQKKWPIAFIIHGVCFEVGGYGPQSAWEDQWSTRWNPNVFTQQGYFVVMINPTGSTTFGQDFTDAIAGDWGGRPFVDLIAGFKYAVRKFPEIDPDRAVALGASWGGYAINWIQGHPEFGFNFKALVCHDGVFDATYNGFSTDELFFFNHEWSGRPWDPDTKKLSEKYSPSNFVHKWSTPQLIIHGSKDYRLPETEGIATFHALQQLGIPSRLVIFPDENHWVLNHGNSLKWHYEVFRWLDQFVGDNVVEKSQPE